MKREDKQNTADKQSAERLAELEKLVNAIRNDEADAIIGRKNVYLLRLKEAEDELVKQRDAYLELYDFAPVGYFTLATDFRILEVNLTGSNMLKIEKQTLVDSVFDKYLSQTEEDKFHVCLKHAEISKVLLECEFELKNNNGVVFPVIARIGWTPDAGHERKCRLAVMDITGLKRAELALKASEQRYRELADSLSEGIYETDAQRKLTYANKRMLSLLEISENDIKAGISLDRYFTPGSFEEARSRFARILQGEDVGVSEYVIRRRNGTEVPVLLHSTAIKNARGIRGVLVDITDRKRVESALRASEQRYRELVDSLSEGIYEADTNANLTYMNLRAKSLLGIKEDDLQQGMSLFDIFCPEYLDKANARVARVLQGEDLGTSDYELRNLDGTSFPALIHSLAIKHENVEGLRGIIVDITEQKKIEDALKANERRFHEMADSLSEGVFEATASGIFTYANRRALGMVGIGKEEISNQHGVFEFISPEQVPHARRRFERIMRGEDLGTEEYTIVARNGNRIPAIIHSLAMPNKEGIRGVIVDISEQKKVEADLRASEQRYRDLADSLSEGIFETDESGKVTYMNRKALAMGGLTEEDIRKGISGFDFIAEESLAKARENLQRTLRGEDVGQQEYVLKKKNGTDYPALVHSLLVKGHGVRAVLIDISERKKAEYELKVSEQRFRDMADSLSEGVYETDEKGIITYLNRRGAALGGITEEDLTRGISVFDFIVPAQIELAETSFARTMRGEDVGPLEIDVRRKDGSTYTALTHNLRIDRDGIRGIRGVVIDITEQKKADAERKRYSQQLEEANAQMQQFVYAVSHDLREPLRMMASFSQALKKHLPGELNEKAAEDINFIVSGAARMQGLLDDLLVYSRISTQAQPFRKVDMEVVLRDVMDNLKISIEESKAVVTHDPLPEVQADPAQMSQILQNLISNAIKFHRKGERAVVHVSCKKNSEWIFSVKDNGIGIDPELYGRLFVIFSRLNPPEEYPGTGMGLAITKRIVQRHGGRVWVESEPGKGATFYFTLAFNQKDSEAVNQERERQEP